jgi:hypothetical protein
MFERASSLETRKCIVVDSEVCTSRVVESKTLLVPWSFSCFLDSCLIAQSSYTDKMENRHQIGSGGLVVTILA